jgi:hypothetical protein
MWLLADFHLPFLIDSIIHSLLFYPAELQFLLVILVSFITGNFFFTLATNVYKGISFILNKFKN